MAQKQREEARREKATHSAEGVAEKHARTDRSDTEMDNAQRVEERRAHLSRIQDSRRGTNIYLIDSDEESIVDIVKDHEELYDKTNEHFKDNTKKGCLWERFANSHSLSRCTRPGWSRKGHIMQAHTIEVWTGPKRYYRKAELHSGKI